MNVRIRNGRSAAWSARMPSQRQVEAANVNLVNELQVSAERDDVLTVLRKTKWLASKLDRQDIAEWLQAEQGGYRDDQPVPEYRKIGTALAYNTNGYIPAGFGYLRNGTI